jgi:hypothetical protein
LLYGFLSGKTQFELEDVHEIVREMHEESAIASKQPPQENLAIERAGEVDFSTLSLDSDLAGALRHKIDSLGFEQSDARLRRLEGSVLRLERINLEILSMLKKMFTVADSQSRETQT